MPRTKRPTNKKLNQPQFLDEGFKKFMAAVEEQIRQTDKTVEEEIHNVEIAFEILTQSIINPAYLKMTVAQLKSELHLNEVPSEHIRPPSHDDGYMTEHSQDSAERSKKKYTNPSTTIRTTGRRSRSADSRRAPQTASRTFQQRARSKSIYRTPAYNKNSSMAYPPITPKVAPHAAMALLREPRAGETVVSLSGSPVLARPCSTLNNADSANCNIMLKDGTLLSLQPTQLRTSTAFIPFQLMNEGTLRQLKILQDNLSKVVKLGEKEFRK